jgi:ATP-binding cassette, subfamily C (CFTR/MRP), member 1
MSLAHVIGPNGLLASRARILVTNSIAFIKEFDQIQFLRRGFILEHGSYDSLMANDAGEIRRLMWVDLFPSSIK